MDVTEVDLVERVTGRLPLEEAEHVLSVLEENLIDTDTINAGLCNEDLQEVGLSEAQGDACLLSDPAWRKKYAGVEEEKDTYNWLDAALTRSLPDALRRNEKICDDILAALKRANIDSETKLLAMTRDQMKEARIPVTARPHLCAARESDVCEGSTASTTGSRDTDMSTARTVSSPSTGGDRSTTSSAPLDYGTGGSLYMSMSGGELDRDLVRLLEQVEERARRDDFLVMSRVRKPKELFLSHTWQKLEDGSDCHARVERVSKKLEARGWTCWLDTQDMGSDVKTSMAQGVEECMVVLIFLSKAYMNKVVANSNHDNVCFEYRHTMNMKGGNEPPMFLPIVLENYTTDKGLKFPDDPRSWVGRIGAEIGPQRMQIRMQDCFADDDDAKLEGKIDGLEHMLFKLLPEKADQRMRQQPVKGPCLDRYDLISGGVERASVALIFITEGYGEDRTSQHEVHLISSFCRPAVPVLVGKSVKWPPLGLEHGQGASDCVRIEEVSEMAERPGLPSLVDQHANVKMPLLEGGDAMWRCIAEARLGVMTKRRPRQIMRALEAARRNPQHFMLRASARQAAAPSPSGRTRPLPKMPAMQGGAAAHGVAASAGKTASKQALKVFSQQQIEDMTDQMNPKRLLGQGGCGSVYKGRLDDGRQVAVKVLHYHGVSDEERLQLMHHMAREVRLLSRVASPFIVKLLGVHEQKIHVADPGDKDKGVSTLVYELCSLGSLEDALECRNAFKHAPMDGTLRFEVLVQACIGLLELHSQGIYHLDFKPANVLLDGGREPGLLRARIGDFGMAKLVHKITGKSTGSSVAARSSRNRTTTSIWITEGYACEEYVSTRKPTDRTDVYALGVTLLRVVTGRAPQSPSGRLVTQVAKTLKKASPDVASICDPSARWCETIAQRLLRLGLKCADADPEERPSMEDILHQLQEMRNGEAPTPLGTDAPLHPHGMAAFQEEDEGPDVDVAIKTTRRTMRLRLSASADLEEVRRQMMIQDKERALRARDVEQFYLKGKVLPDTLTIGELMRDHTPLFNPKTDTLHAMGREAAINPSPFVEAPLRRQEEEQAGAGAEAGWKDAKIQRQVQKHLRMLSLAGFCAASKKDSLFSSLDQMARRAGVDPSIGGVSIDGVTQQVHGRIMNELKAWTRKKRIDIYAACQRIVEGERRMAELRAAGRRWTALEEACVRKVLEYADMEFMDLLHKVQGHLHEAIGGGADTSGSDDARGSGNDDSDAPDEAELENWERIFLKFSRFWRRIAAMAAVAGRTLGRCVLVEAELDFFSPIIKELEGAGWDVEKPVRRIVLDGVRDSRSAAFDCDANSKKQIKRLLAWVKEEEGKLASKAGANLFEKVPETSADGDAGEVQKMDRVLQLAAWLAADDGAVASRSKRQQMRRVLVDKVGAFVERRLADAGKLDVLWACFASVAQHLWRLADSRSDVSLEGLLKAPMDGDGRSHAPSHADGKVLDATCKGKAVSDSGRVEVLEERQHGNEQAVDSHGKGPNESEQAATEDGATSRAASASVAAATEHSPLARALIARLHHFVAAHQEPSTKQRAVYNMEALETLGDHVDVWNPQNNLGIKQAKKHDRMWERMAQLVLAPDLADMSRHRMCKGGKEEERKTIFDIVLPRMEECGWNVKLCFLRFWEGERSLDALLKGLTDKNDIQLVRYVFETYFQPLMDRGGGVVSLEDQVETFYREHIVALTRIVQLTSHKTFNNGRMRFEGRGMVGERQKVMSVFLPQIEDSGFGITAKIISLWNDERDPETLFGGLDDKSRLLMHKLWNLLQVEEGNLAADGIPTMSPSYDAHAATVAYIARRLADGAHPSMERGEPSEVAAMRPRMAFQLRVLVSGFAEEAATRLHEALEAIYGGERATDVLIAPLKDLKAQGGFEPRGFVAKILGFIESSDADKLEAISKEDDVIRKTVWRLPNYEGFFERNLATFRRIVQLCDQMVAQRHAEERLFPGNCDKERGFVMQEFVSKKWKEGSWHLEDAVAAMWAGEHDFGRLCEQMDPGDMGSRYCVFRMLLLAKDLQIPAALAALKASPRGPREAAPPKGMLDSQHSNTAAAAAASRPSSSSPLEAGGAGHGDTVERAGPSGDGMEKLFGSGELKLLAPYGKTSRVNELTLFEVVGIFFSGHWCPPSRVFTPELVKAYTRMRAVGKSLEIVFISSDHDHEEFRSYFKEMPWLALPFPMGDLRDRLSNKFRVEGIPTLVLVDGSTGEVLTLNGREVINNDPHGELFPWYPTSRSKRRAP